MRCGAVGATVGTVGLSFVSTRSWRIAQARSEAWPALYVLRALALALAEQPNAAARLIGGRAVRSDSIDMGVAVEAQDGIMVSVIRGADRISLGDLTNRTRVGGFARGGD